MSLICAVAPEAAQEGKGYTEFPNFSKSTEHFTGNWANGSSGMGVG